MSEDWLYQVRIAVSDSLSTRLRDARNVTASIENVLEEHDAVLVCQFDAFAGYVSEAEREGTDAYPLYRWTKETIEQPEKKAKYLKSFTVHAGGQEIYGKAVAQSLANALSALIDQTDLLGVTTFDTNPANNPQPPRQ